MKTDYKLIDCGNFQKVEQVGPYRFVRPAAQAVWKPRLGDDVWKNVDATFNRASGGDGKWTIHNRSLPKKWTIEQGPVKLVISLTDFGHLGIFPEQDSNWARLHDLILDRKKKYANERVEGGSEDREISVLNLFAYTGGSTLACASAGAKVVHLDASKTSVAWARENAEASGVANRPVRWIVDDVQKFVEREVRRGSKYHGIILDPPSFGRGTNNEVWQVEDHLVPLLANLKQILDDDYLFVLLSCHSNGYTPMALQNLLSDVVDSNSGTLEIREMTIAEQDSGRALPSGASALFIRKKS
jgi:23S rRNA (cytosine1962-C5)-methyltransferase